MSVGAVCLRIARAILTVNNSYDLFIQASPYHRLKKSNVKKYKKYNKITNCISNKAPTGDCCVDLLLGDSALLLCCNESRSKSQNSARVPTLQDLS